MQILLLSNFREDEQKSMLRFGSLLKKNCNNPEIEIFEIYPKSHLQRFCLGSKLKKWGGYFDKYIIFPRIMQSLLQKKPPFDLIHLIDHSNAVYLPKMSQYCSTPTLTTCHDLIAIRTALGDFPAAPVTSAKGKRLQHWIRKSFEHSDFYACDSQETKRNLSEVVTRSKNRSQVIHLGTETVLESNSSMHSSFTFNLEKTKFALHVGSDAWYKNRKALFHAFKFFCENNRESTFKLVVVGPKIQTHELDSQLVNWLRQNRHKVIFLSNITETELQLLYQHAVLFIFPSIIEGFGWPPLEARANGCPTITTKTGAIFEILGNEALYIEPNDQRELNLSVEKLLRKPLNKQPIKFLPSNEDCRRNYADFYKKVISNFQIQN